MLRGINSTQRKIRQIELILKKAGGTLSASGPASNQVTSVSDGALGVISIVLKNAFANEVVCIANSSKVGGSVRTKTDGGVGTAASPVKIISMSASTGTDLADGEHIHLLIIGSDVNSKI
ncbi:MAG TPA: hypothetical protein EYG21_08260 [Nitrospinaceae bacterium]|nr:hypothetical protein [Nitrospinaceae bacterium]